jgi:cell division protein FtsN
MSDYDREPPLTFDARRSSGPQERPRSGLLLISAVILVVLVVAAVVFLLTRGGGEGEQPKTIETMKAPAETPPPAQQTGLTVETAPLPGAPDTTPTFAAPPEQPQPRPVAGGPVAAQPVTGVQAPAAKSKDPIGDKIAALKAPPAPAPVVAKSPAAPTPASAAKVTPAAPSVGGTSMVQIGAFSSQALADQQWNQIAGAFPADMVGKSKRTEQVQVNGNTMYRGLIAGFSSRAEADAFCGKMKAQGRDCFARN